MPKAHDRLRRNCETDVTKTEQCERATCTNAYCWSTLWNCDRRTHQTYKLEIAIIRRVLTQRGEMETSLDICETVLALDQRPTMTTVMLANTRSTPMNPPKGRKQTNATINKNCT